jgi:cytoskeletal protein CcmA (bactofilin family)
MLVSTTGALAFDFASAEDIRVGTGDIVDDDLYAVANNITIDGTVRGDVFAGARTVTVNGTIEGNLTAAAQSIVINGSIQSNLTAAAQSIVINGTVRGSVRVAGQAVMIGGTSTVGRDLLFGGYSLEQKAGTTIGRDVAIGGSQALLAGTVGRNLIAAVESLEVRGSIGGNVDAHVGGGGDAMAPRFTGMPAEIAVPTVAPGLTVAPGAEIGGTLSYTSPREYPIQGRVGRGPIWTQRTEEATTPAPAPTAGSVFADYARRLVALALIGLALVALVPGLTRRLTDVIESRPLPALGWGFVACAAFVGVVIFLAVSAAVLSLVLGLTTLWSLMTVTIVGGALGEAVVISGFVVFVVLVAQALAGYIVGRAVLQRVQPTLVDNRIATLLIGLALFVAVTMVPVLGGLVALAAALLGLGAAWISVRDRPRPAPPALAA